MARDGERRRRSDAFSDAQRKFGTHQGRGRGGGRYASRSRSQQDGTTRSASAGKGNANNNPSRHPANGRRSDHGRKPSKQPPRNWVHLLPDDIVAQSLLPFLVWHDTSALACVNQSFGGLVAHAKAQQPQWKTMSFDGDSAHACLNTMKVELGRGATGALRFAPTLAIVTLAFANTHVDRYTQSVWSEIVETVVAADILPVGCVLVGILDGGLINNHGVQAEAVEVAAKVVLTMSVGSLAQTVVDTAVFDRKALRWSASGLTEELECPFEKTLHSRPSENDKTSLLVWSTGAKPAQVMLSLVTQWFPDASVAGGVVARSDHAPSLMVFTRGVPVVQSGRRTKAHTQRKWMKASTSPHVAKGVLSFPSTLVIRLHGKTFIRPLDLFLDRPLTPILTNEASTMVMDDVDFMRQDIRTYDVSIIDERVGEFNTQSLEEIIYHSAQDDQQDVSGGAITLLSSPTADAFRRMLSWCQDPTPDHRDDGVTGSVRSIPLYVDRRGVMTIRDHWAVGHFGVVSVRRNTKDLLRTIRALVQQRVLAIRQAAAIPLASIVLCSKDVDDGSCTSIGRTLRSCLSEIPGHNIFVDGEIGPIRIPHPIGLSPIQVHTGTVCGFVLCHAT